MPRPRAKPDAKSTIRVPSPRPEAFGETQSVCMDQARPSSGGGVEPGHLVILRGLEGVEYHARVHAPTLLEHEHRARADAALRGLTRRVDALYPLGIALSRAFLFKYLSINRANRVQIRSRRRAYHMQISLRVNANIVAQAPPAEQGPRQKPGRGVYARRTAKTQKARFRGLLSFAASLFFDTLHELARAHVEGLGQFSDGLEIRLLRSGLYHGKVRPGGAAA